jgi:hypothetical protein
MEAKVLKERILKEHGLEKIKVRAGIKVRLQIYLMEPI